MINPLFHESKERYSKTKLASWMLGISLAVLFAGLSCLGVFTPLLSIAAILLIGFPVAFGCIVSHLIAENKEPITFSNQFARSIAFFRNGNSRSFKLLSSFLYSVLIFAITSATITIIAAIVFSIINPQAVQEIYNRVISIFDYTEEVTIQELLGDYYSYFVIFELITEVPASIIAVMFFIYRTSINSLSLYSKRLFTNFEQGFAMLIHNNVFRNIGRKIRKDYFMLNWPLFVLFFIFSFGIGALLSLSITKNASQVASFSIASGFFSLIFFFPFYFGNMEALSQKYEIEYKKACVETTEMVTASIRQRIDLNEEEKKRLEEALKDLRQIDKEDKDDDNI